MAEYANSDWYDWLGEYGLGLNMLRLACLNMSCMHMPAAAAITAAAVAAAAAAAATAAAAAANAVIVLSMLNEGGNELKCCGVEGLCGSLIECGRQ